MHRDRSLAEILPGGLLHKSCQENFFRELVQGFRKETSDRDIAERLVETLPSGPLWRSGPKPSSKDLVRRSCQGTNYGNLEQRHCIQICCADLAKRSESVTYTLPRGHFRELVRRSQKRSGPKTERPLIEILSRKSCQETTFRDLVQRSCQEVSYRDLANRALIETLYRYLAPTPLV